MEDNNTEDVIVNETPVNEENPTEISEENEDVVGTLEDTSEVETTETTESVEEKHFTQKEVDKIIKSRVARVENDYKRKSQQYEKIVNTLKVGMGKNDVSLEELNKNLSEFYQEQGIEIPQNTAYSEEEEIILGNHYADELIDLDDEEEINRIANEIYKIPQEKRTARQKTVFNKLGEYMMHKNAINQLSKEGIDVSIADDEEFKKFASQFSVNTPIKTIYDIYTKVNKKEEIKEKVVKKVPASMGSTKNINSDMEIKEYYTPEEARKFTSKDLDNPKLMKALENSMAKWKK